MPLTEQGWRIAAPTDGYDWCRSIIKLIRRLVVRGQECQELVADQTAERSKKRLIGASGW